MCVPPLYFTYGRLISILPSLGAWILTNGLRFGITKHLGQAVRDHSLASTSSKVRVVAIGIAPWNMIHNREALLSAKVFLACSRQQLLQRHLHLLTMSLRILTTRWTSPPHTSLRTCHTDQSTPWTVITLTSSWWRRTRTDPGPPVRWGWSCSNTSPSSAPLTEVKTFGSLLAAGRGSFN